MPWRYQENITKKIAKEVRRVSGSKRETQDAKGHSSSPECTYEGVNMLFGPFNQPPYEGCNPKSEPECPGKRISTQKVSKTNSSECCMRYPSGNRDHMPDIDITPYYPADDRGQKTSNDGRPEELKCKSFYHESSSCLSKTRCGTSPWVMMSTGHP